MERFYRFPSPVLVKVLGFPVHYWEIIVDSMFHQNFDRQQDPEDSEEPFNEDSEPFVDFTD